MTYPPVDLEAIRPTIADVARLIQHRTVGQGGAEEGTFTSSTRPTAAGVESMTDLALEQVAAVDLPPTMDITLYPAARLAVAAYSAWLIETSYYMGQASPALKSMYDATIGGLHQAIGALSLP